MKRKELIEKWLEALESGVYKQGGGSLYESSSNRYCVMGVLCKVARDAGIDSDFEGNGYLPENIAKKVGMCDDGSFKTDIVYRGREFSNIVRMNDSDIRFKTLARIIREQLEKDNFKKDC